MVNEPHHDGVATRGRKVRLRHARFQRGDVFLLRGQFLQMSQLLAIELGGVDAARRAHDLGGGTRHLAITGSHIGHDAALLPVQQRSQLVRISLVFVLGPHANHQHDGHYQRNHEPAVRKLRGLFHTGHSGTMKHKSIRRSRKCTPVKLLTQEPPIAPSPSS